MAKQRRKPDPKLCRNLWNFSPVFDVPEGDTSAELKEPFFSSSPCQTCGDDLAGNRYSCTAQTGTWQGRGKPVKLDPERVELEICEECYIYIFG